MKTLDLQLVPPNLAALGVKRQGDPEAADLMTIWNTPYPVLTRYKLWCDLVNLQPFAGGEVTAQGSPSIAGYITSGYRDQLVEGRKHSPHLFALAIDVAVGDVHRQLAVAPAALNFFSRIGLYPDNGFIHLDLMPASWLVKYGGRQFWCRIGGVYNSFNTWLGLKTSVANHFMSN